MTLYKFHTLDVFSDTKFGGNPLAVFTDGTGLSSTEMQAIAAEINYSETCFVLPPADSRHAAHVRIFTPKNELPFAGHPNVGTGFLLARYPDLIPGTYNTKGFTFEEAAGLVHISPDYDAEGLVKATTITAPQTISLLGERPTEVIADAVTLNSADIIIRRSPPIIASTGVPFVLAETASREALARATPNLSAFSHAQQNYGYDGDFFSVMLFFEDDIGIYHARMFSPLAGITEDPATGSACTTLGGLIAMRSEQQDHHFTFNIQQGDDMGRPSRLTVTVDKSNGLVGCPTVGGPCVEVMTGHFDL